MTSPTTAVNPVRIWTLLADEGGGGEESVAGGELAGESVEGTSRDDLGLPTGTLDDGGNAGAGCEVVSGGEAVGGVADGGEDDGGEEAARVSISTFIPWLQCPLVPQMKYLLPAEARGMTVLPPV